MNREISRRAGPGWYALWLLCLGAWPAGQALSEPPPICPTDGGWVEPDGSCMAGAHPDYYWPRDCPHENRPEEGIPEDNPAVTPDSGHILYCREPGTAPIPLISCAVAAGEEGMGTYWCQGEPLALDGSLQYAWHAAELDVTVSESDSSLVTVGCNQRFQTVLRQLSLTVSSSNGTAATITVPVRCSP